MFVICGGITYFSASLYVFFKDLIQIVNIIMQVIFWLTPIVWDFNIMPAAVQKVLTFNPVYYVICGYRNIFVYKEFFWNNWEMGIYYWIIAILFLVIGKTVFNKMKIHFADVL